MGNSVALCSASVMRCSDLNLVRPLEVTTGPGKVLAHIRSGHHTQLCRALQQSVNYSGTLKVHWSEDNWLPRLQFTGVQVVINTFAY